MARAYTDLHELGPCWGVVGYAPRSARDLLANITQHAAGPETGG